LCCPHHDRVQSNGILRATDFDDMMLRHPTEVGDFGVLLSSDHSFSRSVFPFTQLRCQFSHLPSCMVLPHDVVHKSND
jgi:hypothetical protein